MTRSRFRRTIVRLAVAASLAATVLSRPGGAAPADQRESAIPRRPDDRTIIHVLNRLGYGPRPGDVGRIRGAGLAAYIDQQLHPERLPDPAMAGRLAGLTTLGLTARELADEYIRPAQEERRARQLQAVRAGMAPGERSAPQDSAPRPPSEAERRARQVLVELSEQKILRAVYSERQLQEVMTDFWFNHFNVFAGKGATQTYVTEYERDVIRPRALGSFRDLLGATAKSPAMLFYLDNWMSVDPAAAGRIDARRGRRSPLGRAPAGVRAPRPGGRRAGLNENYARELMELHTLGVGGGYSQQDVVEVARCFTGWTLTNPREGGGFRFDPRLHDNGTKLVLGHTIKAGGEKDGERVLDILAKHPSTAQFVSTKLVRRFVSDHPPAALVDRAAKRFLATNGDIREVVRLIVTSPEFFAADAYGAKIKTPFEFVVSALRATDARVDDARPLVMSLRTLGMPLYLAQPPTGYADGADAWVSTGGLVARMNFALAATGNRLRGVRVEAAGGEGSALALGGPEFQRR